MRYKVWTSPNNLNPYQTEYLCEQYRFLNIYDNYFYYVNIVMGVF